VREWCSIDGRGEGAVGGDGDEDVRQLDGSGGSSSFGVDRRGPVRFIGGLPAARLLVSNRASSAGWSWCWQTKLLALIRHRPWPTPRFGKSCCSVPVRPSAVAVGPSWSDSCRYTIRVSAFASSELARERMAEPWSPTLSRSVSLWKISMFAIP
jgi:hypothetical protein